MSFKRRKWNEVRWRLTPSVSVILNLYDLVLVRALLLKGLCKENCKAAEKRVLNRNAAKVQMWVEDSN